MEYNMFKLLVDSIPQPIWIKDLDLKFIYVNEEFKKMYKNINKDFIGLSQSEILDGAISYECNKYCNEVIDSLKPITKEVYLDGKYAKVTIIPLIDEDKKLISVAGIYADLDIVNEKDRIIEEQENILKVVMETLPGMVFYKDKEGKYIYANKKFNEFYNGKEGLDQLIGKTNFDVHPTEELALKYTREDIEVLKNKKSIKAETILKSVDGKDIYTEAVKVPVIDRENNAIGVVGLILDVTEKKKAEQELKRISFTDVLTNLYNRTCFEEKAKEFFSEKYFPVGVIMGDANGLKLVNDTLGHEQGDELLKLIAKVLRDVCTGKELIFRTGGDEFVILIPNTTDYECETIIKKIIRQCRNYKHDLIDISIALGLAITYNFDKTIYDSLKEAEDKVYRQKILQKNSLSSSIMYSLQTGLQTKSLETEEHTERVVNNCLIIGERLSLPISVMDELAITANLHDIGKIGISEDILLKCGKLSEEEFEIVKSHTEKGYRIVKASNQLDNVAKGVLTHHERWDGKGYPLKLKGDSIPLIARIISVADAYDVMTNSSLYKKVLSKEEAIVELEKCSGNQFDPSIVSIFVEYLKETSKDIFSYII